jgi:hypothetical protein
MSSKVSPHSRNARINSQVLQSASGTQKVLCTCVICDGHNVWLSSHDQKKHLERDLRKRSVRGPQNPTDSTSRPNLRVFSATTPGIASSSTTKPVVAGSTPDPAVLVSAVTAAEQRGLEHLHQVMFSGEDLDPISRDDSDLDDDGLLNDEPDTSEKQEEHQSESPEPQQNVSLLYGFQPPLMLFTRNMPLSGTLFYQSQLDRTRFCRRLALTHSNMLQLITRRPRCLLLRTFMRTRSST